MSVWKSGEPPENHKVRLKPLGPSLLYKIFFFLHCPDSHLLQANYVSGKFSVKSQFWYELGVGNATKMEIVVNLMSSG